MSSKPRGYFKYLLALDVETTGLCFGSIDPSYDERTGEMYQAVSIGAVVVDADTLKPVKDLYLEIQWDGVSIWSARAEQVHGLSKEYLQTNGVSPEDACVSLAELLLDYWGPDGVVGLIGHNVSTFDKFFVDRLLKNHGLTIKFGNRHVDTHSIGYATFGTYNSDDLFELVGVVRADHNALEDAYASLKVLQTVRALWGGLVEPSL